MSSGKSNSNITNKNKNMNQKMKYVERNTKKTNTIKSKNKPTSLKTTTRM